MREEGAAPGYGQFGGLTRVDLERFFHLDDNDHELIAARRRDSNRLGFAVQLVTVRYLSMFLANPLEVPVEVVDHLAEQLGIDDPSCVKAYTDRKQTRYDHQAEIIRKHGLIEFADIEGELATWIADQAWTTGDGPKAHRRGGAVAEGERRAAAWHHHAGATGHGGQAVGRSAAVDASGRPADGRAVRDALGLLDTREENRRKYVELERLRKGAFTPTSTGMRNALARVRDPNAVIPASVDISKVPARRLIALASHGLTGKTAHLRRM